MKMTKCGATDCEHDKLREMCKFYRFPTDPELRRKWLNLVKCNGEGTEEVLLCGCHFTPGQLEDKEWITGGVNPPDPEKCDGPLENIDQDLLLPLSSKEMLGIQSHQQQEIQVPIVSSLANDCHSDKNVSKRMDYIDWEEYFMATALLAAKRSKDPVTQVGACLVNKDNIIVGTGYNGMPHGCSDDVFPWSKSPDLIKSKHAFVCHAELNAILNTNCLDLSNCTLYVALFPCNECAKVIIQARIRKLIYLSDKHAGKVTTVAAKSMFQAAGVDYRPFQPRRSKIVIDFDNV